MRTTVRWLLTATIGAAGALAAGGRSHAAAPTPVLVELFTSEGCSDCPPADAVLGRLIASQPIAGVEIVGLGQHVDYWDQLGWKDRFSSAALTNRQHVYGARFNLDSVYTPQMIVDGRAQVVGSDDGAARKAIERAADSPHGVVRIAIEPTVARAIPVVVTVENLPPLGRGDHADVIVAITEDRLRTEVKRGENHGRTLTHAAVVRSMTTIGRAALDGPTSAHAELALGDDWQRDQLKIVAFVQEQRGRTILASAAAPLQNARR
jgi:hypothetical protein